MPCTRERAHMSNHIQILARSAHSGGGNRERKPGNTMGQCNAITVTIVTYVYTMGSSFDQQTLHLFYYHYYRVNSSILSNRCAIYTSTGFRSSCRGCGEGSTGGA